MPWKIYPGQLPSRSNLISPPGPYDYDYDAELGLHLALNPAAAKRTGTPLVVPGPRRIAARIKAKNAHGR